MKALSGKQFAKLLESRGWTLQRVQGSHYIYAKTPSPVRLSVPIHRNETLKTGLQRHLMKLAELDSLDPN
ncbi:MAG: type II toxin-antitoxin system HicA family toxin [Acidobacteriota bacterium]